MANETLLAYIKDCRAKGISDDNIRLALLKSGWATADIDIAFRGDAGGTPNAPQAPASPAASSPAASPEVPLKNSLYRSQFSSPLPQSSSYRIPSAQTPRKSRRIFFYSGIVAILLLIGSGLAYGYTTSRWPFSASDETLIRELPLKLEAISWTEYSSLFSLNVEPRDADAKPFDQSMVVGEFGGVTAMLFEPSFYGFLPTDTAIEINATGASRTEGEKNRDAEFQVGGKVKFGDLQIEAGIDFITKEGVYYVRVNKAPALFFDLTPVRGKWIKITEDDLKSREEFGYYSSFVGGFAQEMDEDRARAETIPAQLRDLYALALDESLISITPSGRDGKMRQYRVHADREKIVPFYKRATRELAAKYGTSTIVTADAETEKYLASEEFTKLFAYLSDNTELNFWLDARTGYPDRAEWSFRMAPPDSYAKFAGKQFRTRFQIAFSDINKSSTVETPQDAISLDDATAAISGVTKEEYLASQQISRITSLRYRLRDFKSQYGAFPAALSELTLTRRELTKKYGSTSQMSSYYNDEYYQAMKFMETVPTDAYSKKPYPYRTEGKGYQFTYTIQIPEQPKNPQDYQDVINGTNTATDASFSREGENKPPGSLPLPQGELYRQQRDANRVSDLSTLKSAISLYLADVSSPSLCKVNTVYRSDKGTAAADGTGWLPVNFNEISSGAPIGRLPRDPANTGEQVYTYTCKGTTFEINAKPESDRYSQKGSGDITSTDGGNNASFYEVGNAPGLNLLR